MNTNNTLSKSLAAAAVTLLALSTAHAQTTRAEVKAEAIAAKASQPMGQMSVINQDKGMRKTPSDTTRAEVKAETRAAKKAGELPKGEQSTVTQGMKPAKPMKSDTTRKEVKAEVKAAKKADTLPTGQASVKDQDQGVNTAPKN